MSLEVPAEAATAAAAAIITDTYIHTHTHSIISALQQITGNAVGGRRV